MSVLVREHIKHPARIDLFHCSCKVLIVVGKRPADGTAQSPEGSRYMS